MIYKNRSLQQGFTLIELLVVISILAVLVVGSMAGISSWKNKAKKVQLLGLMKDLQTGMVMHAGEYNRPLIPAENRAQGIDTVYGGEVGLPMGNGFVISSLSATVKYQEKVAVTEELNPDGKDFVTFKLALNSNSGGLGKDGNLYDPWGNQILIAVNGLKGLETEDFPQIGEVPGTNDKNLNTYGYGDYSDRPIRENNNSFVVWSFGEDNKKGKKSDSPRKSVKFDGSDDVLSW